MRKLLLIGIWAALSSGVALAGYQDCSVERASPRVSDESTNLQFVNRTSHDAVVYWVDFDGIRKAYRTLAPGASYNQQTYVGHVWVITHPNGVCKFVYTAESGTATVDIY